jgi:large subunit ribosomal protein L25
VADLKLTAQTRTEFGKGAARRTRRAGLIPAVIHGHGEQPIHLSLPGHATTLALRHANALLEIQAEDATHLALVREVQRDAVRDVIEHVDLQAVRAGEKIEVEIPIHVQGEPVTGIAILDTQTIRVLAEATNLPESITVSVDGLDDGDTIRASDLALPEGVVLVGDDDLMILSISIPRSEVEEEAAESAEGEAGEAAEDPEATA